MSESQVKLNENRKKHLDLLAETMQEQMPGLDEGLDQVWGTAYADGALSAKVKRLMALVLALGAGCRNCVLAQAELALKAGATKQEFLEAIAVVISMRGTTGIAESLRVVQFLSEQGKW
jgi:AhpD family alkylhydroperoxidase